MEEIAFSDWPGQPVDLNAGNNPWQPAYGFQTPTTLLEKEDFIGNPGKIDAFNSNSKKYTYKHVYLSCTQFSIIKLLLIDLFDMNVTI